MIYCNQYHGVVSANNFYTPDKPPRRPSTSNGLNKAFATYSTDRQYVNKSLKDSINYLEPVGKKAAITQPDFGHERVSEAPTNHRTYRKIVAFLQMRQSRVLTNLFENPDLYYHSSNNFQDVYSIGRTSLPNGYSYPVMKQTLYNGQQTNDPINAYASQQQKQDPYRSPNKPTYPADERRLNSPLLNRQRDRPLIFGHPLSPSPTLNRPENPVANFNHLRNQSQKATVPQRISSAHKDNTTPAKRNNFQAKTEKGSFLSASPGLRFTHVARTRSGETAQGPKQNQDSYCVVPNFCGNKSANLFMVMDGHGPVGHLVSNAVKFHLPKLFEKQFSRFINESLEDKLISNAFLVCFTQIEQLLAADTKIDCSLSGSTVTVTIIVGDKLWCGNVGDSRAILISNNANQKLIYPLSNDHKPGNVEEEKRIVQSGGTVSPVRTPHGQFIGPKRVWDHTHMYPGLAMSRSVGDHVAHRVGVISTPEIIGHTISKCDRYIILGTDGLFEWLSNEYISNVVSSSQERGNSIELIADFLVNVATQSWYKLGDQVDDITLILVYVEWD